MVVPVIKAMARTIARHRSCGTHKDARPDLVVNRPVTTMPGKYMSASMVMPGGRPAAPPS